MRALLLGLKPACLPGEEEITLAVATFEQGLYEAEVWHCLGTMLIRQDREEVGLSQLKTALPSQPDVDCTQQCGCYQLSLQATDRTVSLCQASETPGQPTPSTGSSLH